MHGDIKQGRRLVAGVGEGALGHLHECLTLGLDTLDGSGLREPELELGLREREVGTSTGLDLDKLVQVSLVLVELQVLNLKDVGAAIVQESRVVGHNDSSHIVKRLEVLLHPSNIDNVQAVKLCRRVALS